MSQTTATQPSYRSWRHPLVVATILIVAALPNVACNGASGEGGRGWNPLKTELPDLRDGIKDFNDSKWVDAEKKFEDANNKQPSSEGHFDEGSALYRQKKTAEAAEQLRKVLSSTDGDLKERAYFNLGNAEAGAGDLEKAKEDYRRALELRPHDADARYNLEWASRTIEQKKEQAKKDSKDGQKDPKDSKDEKKDEKKDDQKQAQNDKDKKDDQKKDDQKKDDAGKKEDQQAQNDKKDQQDKDGQQKDKGDQQQAQKDQQPPDKDKQGQDPQKGESKEDKQDKGAAGAQASNQADATKQQARPMTQQETASVLNALEAGEKSLQMWKFDQKQNRPRSGLEKDW